MLWVYEHIAPLCMGFSRQEYWTGLPFPSLGDLPDPRIKPVFSALAGGFFTVWATRYAHTVHRRSQPMLVSWQRFKSEVKPIEYLWFLNLCVCVCVCVWVAQSCPTLCNPMDYSLSVSSVPGILKAGILEWVVISFSRGSSRTRDRTLVSCIAGRLFTVWATGKFLNYEDAYLFRPWKFKDNIFY